MDFVINIYIWLKYNKSCLFWRSFENKIGSVVQCGRRLEFVYLQVVACYSASDIFIQASARAALVRALWWIPAAWAVRVT